MTGASSTRRKRFARSLLPHALAVADVMVSLEISARNRKDLELLDESALMDLHDRATGATRWSMHAEVRTSTSSQRVVIVPDAVFALRFRTFGRIAYFFLEIDRGTMPINSEDLAKSSYRRKLLGYHAALKAGQHTERFGFQNARMLTVTTNQERVQSMIGVINGINRGVESGRFLFAEQRSLIDGDPLDFVWAGQSRGVRIDTPPRTR